MPLGRLARGLACISCRRRKIACNGVRPVCGECSRKGYEEDCEYTDQAEPTRTEMLEETIAILESRIRGLEQGGLESNAQSSAARSGTLEFKNTSLSMGPFSETDDLPPDVSNMLINLFLPHATQLGFAIDIPRFKTSLTFPRTHPHYPHSTILNSIYIWSLRLSNSPDLLPLEHHFLQKALDAVKDAVGSNQPKDRIHVIQAEVLLSNYFFVAGRFLEGRYHSSAAASLAMGSGLHRSPFALAVEPRSHGRSQGLVGKVDTFTIPPPADNTDAGDRTNVFWSVFNVDQCWSAIMGERPVISEDPATLGMQIDAPWPSDSGIELRSNVNSTYSRTVIGFLSGATTSFSESAISTVSSLAVRAQTSAIFQFATNSARQSDPRSPRDVANLRTISRNVEFYINALPNLSSLPMEDLPAHIVARTLGYAALIQLTESAARSDQGAHSLALRSARSIVELAELAAASGGIFLDPIVSGIWSLATNVFAQDAARRRSYRGMPQTGDVPRVRAALGTMNEMFPSTANQIDRALEALRGL
ncbi:hypothetical protein BD410DRAFT_897602 [Rickenella mellea]|uniref:Zn(2)-C6 fungal-type domain-containing protein n=1 Tax=Rickenella mellea TaxID=50990 RepID=A0A4Y7Q8Y6_9AGAM|nr:hypothetical protein BD410DRAFT_897602 [Rickenella mellea]